MSKVTFMPQVVSSITDVHTTTSVLLACLVLVIMATSVIQNINQVSKNFALMHHVTFTL